MKYRVRERRWDNIPLWIWLVYSLCRLQGYDGADVLNEGRGPEASRIKRTHIYLHKDYHEMQEPILCRQGRENKEVHAEHDGGIARFYGGVGSWSMKRAALLGGGIERVTGRQRCPDLAKR